MCWWGDQDEAGEPQTDGVLLNVPVGQRDYNSRCWYDGHSQSGLITWRRRACWKRLPIRAPFTAICIDVAIPVSLAVQENICTLFVCFTISFSGANAEVDISGICFVCSAQLVESIDLFFLVFFFRLRSALKDKLSPPLIRGAYRVVMDGWLSSQARTHGWLHMFLQIRWR